MALTTNSYLSRSGLSPQRQLSTPSQLQRDASTTIQKFLLTAAAAQAR